jgi:crooked neck
MEELLGNFGGARQVFERWMAFEPEDNGWTSYVKFEERCGEIDRARRVFERYVSVHPTQPAFLRLVKFEERHGRLDRARAGYESACNLIGGDDDTVIEQSLDQYFYIRFAEFEVRAQELERARAIYKLALEKLPKNEALELYGRYVSFEKQHGTQEEIEDTVTQKRKFHYEEKLRENSLDYDVWFDYLRLMEANAGVGAIVGRNPNNPNQKKNANMSTVNPDSAETEAVRELYERAIGQKPLIPQKDYWRR